MSNAALPGLKVVVVRTVSKRVVVLDDGIAKLVDALLFVSGVCGSEGQLQAIQ